MSTTVTLREFQKLTGLPNAVLGWLLARNRIPCAIDPRSGLMVDLDQLQTKELITGLTSAREEIFETDRRRLVEEVGSIVTKEFEAIVEQAIQAAKTGIHRAG